MQSRSQNGVRRGWCGTAGEERSLPQQYRGLKVDNPVDRSGPNGGLHELSVQLFLGLFGVMDCSVREIVQDLRAKPALERCLLIPGTWVHCYRGIGGVSRLKGYGQELTTEQGEVVLNR